MVPSSSKYEAALTIRPGTSKKDQLGHGYQAWDARPRPGLKFLAKDHRFGAFNWYALTQRLGGLKKKICNRIAKGKWQMDAHNGLKSFHKKHFFIIKPVHRGAFCLFLFRWIYYYHTVMQLQKWFYPNVLHVAWHWKSQKIKPISSKIKCNECIAIS